MNSVVQTMKADRVLTLLTSHPLHSYGLKISLTDVTEYSELGETHKDHQIQLLSEWPAGASLVRSLHSAHYSKVLIPHCPLTVSQKLKAVWNQLVAISVPPNTIKQNSFTISVILMAILYCYLSIYLQTPSTNQCLFITKLF